MPIAVTCAGILPQKEFFCRASVSSAVMRPHSEGIDPVSRFSSSLTLANKVVAAS